MAATNFWNVILSSKVKNNSYSSTCEISILAVGSTVLGSQTPLKNFSFYLQYVKQMNNTFSVY